MWLTEVKLPGPTMNELCTKIQRHSCKHAFSSRRKSSRKREPASERVDWEFVCFPSPSKASSRQNNANSSELSEKNQSHTSHSQSHLGESGRKEPPITFNWNEPVMPRNSWSFASASTTATHEDDGPPPPPVPPRLKSRPSPIPPPRPASLSSKHDTSLSTSSSPGEKLFNRDKGISLRSSTDSVCPPYSPRTPTPPPPLAPRKTSRAQPPLLPHYSSSISPMRRNVELKITQL